MMEDARKSAAENAKRMHNDAVKTAREMHERAMAMHQGAVKAHQDAIRRLRKLVP